jgi:type III secretion protein T
VSWVNEIDSSLGLLQPHLASVAVIACRLLPVAFLCPLFGGSASPMTVKLGVVASLSLFLHVACGISLSGSLELIHVGAVAFEEIVFGATLGLLASLPFDAARMGGKFVDLFRGSSAEAALPLVGSKEAASGDLLYNILVAAASVSFLMPLLVTSLFRSFHLVPLGQFVHTDEVAMAVVRAVSTAMGTALAIGAPIAGVALGADLLLGLAGRASSNINLQDAGSPLKILGGGAVFWLMLGLAADRLMAFAADSSLSISDLLHLGAPSPL